MQSSATMEGGERRMVEKEGIAGGSLGVARIVFFVVAAAAPLSGTLGAVPIAVGFGAGAGAALAFLVAGALLALFSVGYTRMSREVSEPGAFYAYIAQGLGRPVGAGGALVAVASYAGVQMALYGLFGFFCVAIMPAVGGVHLPWWVYALASLILAAALARRRVDLNARVLGTLVMLEAAIVLVVIATTAWHAGGGAAVAAARASIDPVHIGDPGFGIAVMFAFACYIGFEATAIYAGEARDPARTIPRATFVAVGIITLFFVTACWGLVCAYGADRVKAAAAAGPGEIWFAIAGARLGPAGVSAMQLFLLASIFAGILAFQNALARYIEAVARDGYVPRALARCDPSSGVPVVANRVQAGFSATAILIAAILRLDPYVAVFGWLSAYATLGILLLQALVSLAVIGFFRKAATRGAGHGDGWATAAAPALSFLGLAAVTVVMLRNLPLLAGTTSRWPYVMPAFHVAMLLAGIMIAIGRPRRDPASTGAEARSS